MFILSFCVSDYEAPQLVGCPASQVLASGDWNITATDNSGTVPQVSCNPPLGSTFTPGPTWVTCTASDDSGNNDTCNFDVYISCKF